MEWLFFLLLNECVFHLRVSPSSLPFLSACVSFSFFCFVLALPLCYYLCVVYFFLTFHLCYYSLFFFSSLLWLALSYLYFFVRFPSCFLCVFLALSLATFPLVFLIPCPLYSSSTYFVDSPLSEILTCSCLSLWRCVWCHHYCFLSGFLFFALTAVVLRFFFVCLISQTHPS